MRECDGNSLSPPPCSYICIFHWNKHVLLLLLLPSSCGSESLTGIDWQFFPSQVSTHRPAYIHVIIIFGLWPVLSVNVTAPTVRGTLSLTLESWNQEIANTPQWFLLLDHITQEIDTKRNWQDKRLLIETEVCMQIFFCEVKAAWAFLQFSFKSNVYTVLLIMFVPQCLLKHFLFS